jgi:hypothetical protein
LLAQVAFDLGPIGKTEQNKEQGFNYRGIEQILAKAGPLMAAAGIVWLPKVIDRQVEIILVGKYQKPWRLVSLTVEYRIVGPKGDAVTCVSYGEGFDPGDKSGNKAMSGAFKYALLQVLGISSGHHDADSDPAPDIAGRREETSGTPGGGPTAKPRKGPKAPKYGDAPTREPKPVPPKGAPADVDPETGEVDAPDVAVLTDAFPGAAIVTEDDPRRSEIGAALAGIDDEDFRRQTKNGFLESFGGAPGVIPDDVLDEALAWTLQAIKDGAPF